PTTSAYMQFRLAEARQAGTPLEIRHRPVPLDSIPPVLIRAVLLAEDDRFRSHGGVDWEALAEEVRYRGPLPPSPLIASDRAAVLEAVQHVLTNRDSVRGRSTITQQLARNLYLSPDRSMVRKGQELVIAWRLEWFLSKDRILELYLNLAEFGDGVFGVGAAAEVHFGRDVWELGRVEAASLAATLPHPRTSNPSHNPARMEWRRDRILERLAR
ncbi:MAG: monofunctional biosynthetic peptidoglycan transglycosylase, partial [Gemmatimonadales bacterium]